MPHLVRTLFYFAVTDYESSLVDYHFSVFCYIRFKISEISLKKQFSRQTGLHKGSEYGNFAHHYTLFPRSMRNPDRETTFRFKRFSVENRRSAMKVGTDGVLLGAWADVPGNLTEEYKNLPNPVPRILDIGAGTGLVSLMLAQRFPTASVTAIEIDSDSAKECAVNFRQSPWAGRLETVHDDFLAARLPAAYNLIVSNPPFFNNGAKAPDSARHIARHEDSLPLDRLIARASNLLEPMRGSLALVLPTERCDEAVFAAEISRLYLWRKVMVTTVPGKAPRRVLLQFLNRETPSNITAEYLSDSSGNRSEWHRALVKDFYLKP